MNGIWNGAEICFAGMPIILMRFARVNFSNRISLQGRALQRSNHTQYELNSDLVLWDPIHGGINLSIGGSAESEPSGECINYFHCIPKLII